ncbi:hypothetical protein [Streptomyces sp. NBC_01803]|uniref:hypothetical protein n=1 Tax=Streptomyces sp. NBC_01803 TaxID=2975946 RepID=UPI002DD815BA|nr:hypothetical protein [Streptomyces sp. NBC_01803]WSA47451.1 hypothetical protein OIE51_26740 [Streptomyces sp. NBC_01803]
MVMDDDEAAELVLAQTAHLLNNRGDREAAQLLTEVDHLEFERTDDSFTTSSNWHEYFYAAVLHVEEHLEVVP